MVARLDCDRLRKVDELSNNRAVDITLSQGKTKLQHSNSSTRHPLSKSEDIICDFFIDCAQKEAPNQVLKTFSDFFVEQNDRIPEALKQVFSDLLIQDEEQYFTGALNRCCYILINHWIADPKRHNIQRLINLLLFTPQVSTESSPLKEKSRQWLNNFLAGEQWQQIQSFALRYTEIPSSNNDKKRENWKNRYSYYLLSEQCTNLKNPQEQREASRLASQQIGRKFKFNLAMHLARQSAIATENRVDTNPTQLSDRALSLIQKTLTRKRQFDYRNIANIFLKQTDGVLYKSFKQSLLKYLLFSFKENSTSDWLRTRLSDRLDSLYPDYNDRPLNAKLLLRTCNRLIEFLTQEDTDNPVNILTILAIQRNYLTWAIILLKIVLISPSSYNHLMSRTAALIQLYEDKPESDCQWLIRFLETLTVVLTIAFDRTRYPGATAN